MTIDKHTIDQAKKWAARVAHYTSPSTPQHSAAVEVIQALPDTVVDGDKLREVIEEMVYSLEQTVSDDEDRAHDVATARWKDKLEALLPAPAPQVEIKLGAWAMHPEYGKVLIAAAHPDSEGDVRVVCEVSDRHDGSDWVWSAATDLSPLPDTHDDSAPDQGECRCAPVPSEKWTTHYGAVDPATMTEYEPSCPVHGEHYWDGEKYQLNQQHAEPQPGEAWETDRKGWLMIRTESGWFSEHGHFSDKYCTITPLRRLVPAQEPRVLTTVEDYENAADGTVAHWGPTVIEKKNGAWYSTGSNAWNETDSTMSDHGPCTVLWEPEA